MRILKTIKWVFVALVLMLAGPGFYAMASSDRNSDWRTASRDSTGIAPDALTTREAIVHVYAARAFRWRGHFAVHSWIATKGEGDPEYLVYEVVGWGVGYGGKAIRVRRGLPDREWYGARPDLLAELRGPEAAKAIHKIQNAVITYPYQDSYTTWPGPNSNTFVAHILRQVPELRADLPPTAIGKDYLPGPDFIATTPSGTGGQVSLFGLLGIAVGIEEGLEVNVLGLNFGVDPGELALRLPGFGKIGFNTQDLANRDD